MIDGSNAVRQADVFQSQLLLPWHRASASVFFAQAGCLVAFVLFPMLVNTVDSNARDTMQKSR